MVSNILNRCQGGRLCRFLGAASVFATAVCINLRSVPTSSRAAEPVGQLRPRLADTSQPMQPSPQDLPPVVQLLDQRSANTNQSLQPGTQGQGAKYRKLLRTVAIEEDRAVLRRLLRLRLLPRHGVQGH